MPFFNYTAKNQLGKSVKGKAEAQNLKQASLALQERGLLVISLKPLTEDSLSAVTQLFSGVKTKDIVGMTRQLSTMISAGLPLTNALSILVQQSRVEVSRLVATILQDVEGGVTFSAALEKHPKVFSRLYVQLVAAGEAGGVLDQVLERLADNLEKDKEFKGKTRGALIYPMIVMLAMVVVGIIMMVFVIPKLTVMYEDFDAELPLATKGLMAISDIMTRYFWVLIIGLVAFVIGFLNWKKTPTGQRMISAIVLKIPVVKQLIPKIMLTEFARTQALLLGAGVPLLQSLAIVAKSIDNVVYREALEEATDQVEKGVSLSAALSRHEVFPPILFHMIAVGEETGKLDEVLNRLSKYFEMESEQAVKNMTTAIEPLIMIVLGIGVGLMVIAVIMPIYNLTSQF